MTPIIYSFLAYAAVFALWVLYLAGMNLRGNLHRMGPIAKAHGYVVMVPAVVLDWLVNTFLGSLFFWETPWTCGELLTGRLRRYHGPAYAGSWRARAAEWICTNLLNPFDPSGNHC